MKLIMIITERSGTIQAKTREGLKKQKSRFLRDGQKALIQKFLNLQMMKTAMSAMSAWFARQQCSSLVVSLGTMTNDSTTRCTSSCFQRIKKLKKQRMRWSKSGMLRSRKSLNGKHSWHAKQRRLNSCRLRFRRRTQRLTNSCFFSISHRSLCPTTKMQVESDCSLFA